LEQLSEAVQTGKLKLPVLPRKEPESLTDEEAAELEKAAKMLQAYMLMERTKKEINDHYEMLTNAVEKGELEQVKIAVKYFVEKKMHKWISYSFGPLDGTNDYYYYTPLYVASIKKHVHIVKYLAFYTDPIMWWPGLSVKDIKKKNGNKIPINSLEQIGLILKFVYYDILKCIDYKERELNGCKNTWDALFRLNPIDTFSKIREWEKALDDYLSNYYDALELEAVKNAPAASKTRSGIQFNLEINLNDLWDGVKANDLTKVTTAVENFVECMGGQETYINWISFLDNNSDYKGGGIDNYYETVLWYAVKHGFVELVEFLIVYDHKYYSGAIDRNTTTFVNLIQNSRVDTNIKKKIKYILEIAGKPEHNNDVKRFCGFTLADWGNFFSDKRFKMFQHSRTAVFDVLRNQIMAEVDKKLREENPHRILPVVISKPEQTHTAREVGLAATALAETTSSALPSVSPVGSKSKTASGSFTPTVHGHIPPPPSKPQPEHLGEKTPVDIHNDNGQIRVPQKLQRQFSTSIPSPAALYEPSSPENISQKGIEMKSNDFRKTTNGWIKTLTGETLQNDPKNTKYYKDKNGYYYIEKSEGRLFLLKDDDPNNPWRVVDVIVDQKNIPHPKWGQESKGGSKKIKKFTIKKRKINKKTSRKKRNLSKPNKRKTLKRV
jgi:hypothetical protein